jgi:hypothetical protein
MILAIDPGPEQSAYVLYDCVTRHIERQAKLPNKDMLWKVREYKSYNHPANDMELVVEMIASYGMPVGREVFETCVWIGRYIQAWVDNGLAGDKRYETMYRSAVKLHLCGSMRAKDGNVRQALIDAFGGKEKAIGKKAQPGPLYGVSGDVWSALAVAVTYADRQEIARSAA